MDKISKIFMFDTSILIFTVNIPKQPQNKNRKNKKNEKSRKFISRENRLFFLPAKVSPHKVNEVDTNRKGSAVVAPSSNVFKRVYLGVSVLQPALTF